MAEKVSSGQRVRTTPLYQASVQNRLMAMLEAFEAGKLKGLAGGSKLRGPQTDIVHVKNLTGADLALGSVVQLGGSLIDDVAGLWFEGNLAGDPLESKLAIVREPLPEDAIGVAQVSGVCVALVEVVDAAHAYATAADGLAVLASGDTGPLEILSAPDGTGEQLLAVRFSSPPPAEESAQAKWIKFTLPSALTDAQASKASCTVDDFWDGDDPGATATVYNRLTSTADVYSYEGDSGATGYAVWNGAQYFIVDLDCPA